MKIESTAPVEELPSLPWRGYGDGYDWQEEVHTSTPWAVIPSWGRDGWDMGSWPYVQILTCTVVVPPEQRQPKRHPWCVHCRRELRPDDTGAAWLARDEEGSQQHVCPATDEQHFPARRTKVYGVASYCEGDVERYAFEQHEDRIAALDALAHFYWRMSGEEHFARDGMVPIGPLAAKWFGMFSFDRADAERGEPLVVVEERR